MLYFIYIFCSISNLFAFKQIFVYLENVSSSSLTCLCFLTESEILCCNELSQMKLWDLRVNKNDIAANINNFTQVINLNINLYRICYK